MNYNYAAISSCSNSEIKSIIFKAIHIYSFLENKDIDRPSGKEEYNPRKLKDKNEIALLSLLLSLLSTNNKAKLKLNEDNINLEVILQTIKVNKLELPALNGDQCNDIYNKSFKTIINNFLYLANNLYDIGDISSYSPDVLFLTLIDHRASLSNIIKDSLEESGIPENILSNIVNKIQSSSDISDGKEQVGDGASSIEILTREPESKSKTDISIKELGYYLDDVNFLIDPAIDRDEEIKSLLRVLATPKKSAILIGDSGVGKTAIVDGLAYRLKHGNVPGFFKEWKIYKADISSVISDTQYRGQFEKKFNVIVNLAKDNKIFLFIDDIYAAFRAGETADNNINVANILKPYLSDSRIKLIGTASTSDYDKYLNIDSAFKNDLNCIEVCEPEDKVLRDILLHTIPLYEQINKVTFGLEGNKRNAVIDAIVEVTYKSHRTYYDKQYNPSLALSVLGDAFAAATIRDSSIVEKEDIISAIKSCERINKSVRFGVACELQEIGNLTQEGNGKIISLF